jgi:type I restriction enzyme S subunit
LYLGLEHLASGLPALVGRGTESDVRSGKTSFRSGDVLFGKLRPYLRKSVLVGEDGICSTDILVFRATEKSVPEFICLLTHTDEFVGHAKATTSGVQHPRTSWSGLREFKLHVPPVPEQRKIAGVLGVVQRAIEQQERLLALTADLKKALLHQLFTAGLRGEPQKQTEIGLVPDSWQIMPLGALAKIGNGSTPKRGNNGYWQGGTIPWLNSSKIHERFITAADQFVTDLAVKECHLPRVKPGSLLIAITGQGKTLGNSALVSFGTCINQHLAYAQFTSPRVVPEFILWFMQTRYEHLRSISQAGGSTKGALTCGYLKTYSIPVPSLDEQREIASAFAALDLKEKVHERKHAALNALFRTLLHQFMTAQLRVHTLDLP